MTDDKIEDKQANPQSCTECQGVNTSTVSTRLNLNLFYSIIFSKLKIKIIFFKSKSK